jgi:hypothetical protein
MVGSVLANRGGRPILGRAAILVGTPHNAQVFVVAFFCLLLNGQVKLRLRRTDHKSGELHRCQPSTGTQC